MRSDGINLFEAFASKLTKTNQKEKLIKCVVCCLEGVPACGKGSSICEMCFEDDFWDGMLD